MTENIKQARDEKKERIAKRLARTGIASRREAERMIEAGRVHVNGTLLTTPAFTVSDDDHIEVDGKPIGEKAPPRVWRYHKPIGLMTTHSDPEGRPTVFENLPEGLPRVISVGRLDMNSEGILLLTNDGELARMLELPSTGWARKYRARAYGRCSQDQLDTLQKGIKIDGLMTGPIEASFDKQKGDNAWINVTIREGKNREVRRALETLGLQVNRLIRVAYGPFQLGTLAKNEVEEVRRSVLRDQVGHFVDIPKGRPTHDRQVQDSAKKTNMRSIPRSASDARRRKEELDNPELAASRKAERQSKWEAREKASAQNSGLADAPKKKNNAKWGREKAAEMRALKEKSMQAAKDQRKRAELRREKNGATKGAKYGAPDAKAESSGKPTRKSGWAKASSKPNAKPKRGFKSKGPKKDRSK